jgi:hypothetical protein
MAKYDPSPSGGLSRGRQALLGVYAALDDDLRRVLRYVHVEFPARLDPGEQLAEAVAARREEQGQRAVHRLQLAFAAMAVVDRGPGPEIDTGLLAVAAELADPKLQPAENESVVLAIVSALQEAVQANVPAEVRWAFVVERVGPELHPDLRKIKHATCRAGLRAVGDEIMSRVETELVVADPRDLDRLSKAVLPDNWKVCNDFFCELIPRPERDVDCPGSTPGPLSPGASHWRGVYEERVGDCPGGWFPDTYLTFTWDRTPNQIILRYELAPRRHGDRTVLKIDQGYLQVDRVPGAYHVSTVKNLLFDDRFIPSGGQVLGGAACQLGWLDHCVNQFTDCTDTLADKHPGSTPTVDGVDAGLTGILDRCQAHLQESAADTDQRITNALTRIREDRYGLDDYVNDWAGAVRQGLRDGARSLTGLTDLGRELLNQADRNAR